MVGVAVALMGDRHQHFRVRGEHQYPPIGAENKLPGDQHGFYRVTR